MKEIEDLIKEAKAISIEVPLAFGKLSEAQLNFKRNPDSWSVAQCLEHLIIADRLYMNRIGAVVDETHSNNVFAMIPFLPSLLGGFIKKAVHPDNVKKVKTFSYFEPATSDLSTSILGDFTEMQNKFVANLEALKDRDLEGIKIQTPISKAFNIMVSDACELLVLHQRRHFNQASRVTKMEEFPA